MYYLLWIAESAEQIHAPHCEIATNSLYTMYEYCENLIAKFYHNGEYVVMAVDVLTGTTGKNAFTQSTFNVQEFIDNFKEDFKK